jgi:hypothetical protein
MVAQAHNPSFSGGRDWEDHILRLVYAKVQETPSQTMAGCDGVCQFYPSYAGNHRK